MDTKSKKLKRKSKKDVKVDLYGAPSLDIRTVDWSSIRLEGVAPSKVKLKHEHDDDGDDDDGDRGPRGPHLDLKFDGPAVLAGLDARLALAPAPVATAAITMPVVSFSGRQVAEALFGAPMGADIAGMDRVGNGNGMLDIGDLRAAVMADGVVLAAGKEAKSEKSEKSEKDKGVPHTIVLSGTLTDGTPFWAEGSVLIKEEN